jgi:hypothetical protein
MSVPGPTAHALAFAEYDFMFIDARLSDLILVLFRCSDDVPICLPASRRLKKVRHYLRRVLDTVDKDITEAVRDAEGCDSPPF